MQAQNQFNISQYMLYQAFVNPAASSTDNTFNAALFHRSQWVGVSGAPTTQGLSANLPFQNAKHTIGLMVLHDKIGVNDATQVGASYAYKLKLGANTNLAFGLGAMANIVKSNYSRLNLGDDVYDQTFSSNSPSIVMPNFRFGLYLTGKRYYAGAAIPNLLQNRIVSATNAETRFNGKDLHYYLQGGYLFQLGERSDLGLSTLIKEASGAPMQFDFNAQYIWNKKLGVGVSYRTSKELVGMVNYQITKNFKLGYAYDYNMSSMAKYTSGSHEIMLIFHIVNEKVPVGFFSPRF